MCIAMGKTRDCDSRGQTLVSEPDLDQTLFTESAVDQTPGENQPDLDEKLSGNEVLYQITVVELDDTTFNSSFKSIGLAEDEEVLAEGHSDSGMYCDAETVEEGDDEDYDQLDHSRRMSERHHGQGYCPRVTRGRGLYRSPKRLCWSPLCAENNKQEENSPSLFQSDVGEANLAMVGAGLFNLGNTCFLNAILQCFTHTVPLVKGLRSYNHPKPCESDSEGFCVFCALHDHIELAIRTNGNSISPMKIVENLNQLSSDFRRYQQEDAHELLQSLLDKLDRCCNDSKTDHNDENLVQRLFGGRLVSKLKCCNCGHRSNTFEPLIDLSLEIENANSLLDALESFTKVEKIEDEEPQFTCESCKEKVIVEKQLMVDHAPSIATFHLKRFKNEGSHVEKIDKHVEFPLELDLKRYTSGGQNDNVDLNYSLYAIVVHSGFSPTSGHYFCFIRSAPDVWYQLDDSQVTRVSESSVLFHEAYILLYAKTGTPWFSTFMETEKVAMDCNASSSTSPKSVLEKANESSELSPIMEANIVSEVNEEDRREAMSISGSSFNDSGHKDELGSAKVDSKIGKRLFTSTFGGEDSVISHTSFKSVFDMGGISESSPTIDTNICIDVDEEDERDAMEIYRTSFEDCGHGNRVKEAKGDPKIETSSASPALRCDDSNQKDAEFTRTADFNSSTSQRSSRLSSNDFILGDRDDGAKDDSKVAKKLSPSARRGEVGKSSGVNSVTVSAKSCSKQRDHVMAEKVLPCKRQSSYDRERKEACRLVKGMPCSNRRSQLMAVVKSNSEACSNNKRAKINDPLPSRKDGPSNLVPLRRPVAPGRF